MSALVYALITDKSNKRYIGSTTKNLNTRLIQHRSLYRGGNKSVSSHILFDEGDVSIIQLEECPYDDRKIRERFWIEHFGDDCVNKIIPSRTKQEYDSEYGLVNKERKKEYRERNKEHISKVRRERYERTRDYLYEKIPCEFCGFVGVRVNLKRHQQTQKCLLTQNLLC